MKYGIVLASVLAFAMCAGTPAFAKAKRSSKPSVSCKQIKDAMASGKSEDDVQKDLNVSATRVKSCTAPRATHHRKSTAKKS